MKKDAQDRLRNEVQSTGLEAADYSVLQHLPFLASVIYETLRMFPPISQLINRRTTRPVLLGNQILIPEGTYVGYNAYATGRDQCAWGADADEFKPERWGTSLDKIQTMYRRVNHQASFIAFHGGRRACLGQKFAMFETRISVFELVKRVKWVLDPTWIDRMTPVSLLPFRSLFHSFKSLLYTHVCVLHVPPLLISSPTQGMAARGKGLFSLLDILSIPPLPGFPLSSFQKQDGWMTGQIWYSSNLLG